MSPRSLSDLSNIAYIQESVALKAFDQWCKDNR